MHQPVRDRERAILLGYTAWYSEQAMGAPQGGTIDAVTAVLTGKRPVSVVNPEVYDRIAANE